MVLKTLFVGLGTSFFNMTPDVDSECLGKNPEFVSFICGSHFFMCRPCLSLLRTKQVSQERWKIPFHTGKRFHAYLTIAKVTDFRFMNLLYSLVLWSFDGF